MEIEAQSPVDGGQLLEGASNIEAPVGGGEAAKPWWADRSPEEIDGFLQSEAAKPHIDRRLQSEVDRARTSLKQGKLDKVNAKVAQLVRETEEAAQQRIQQAMQAQQSKLERQRFEDWWATATPEQRAQAATGYIDSTLQTQQQQQYLEQQLEPEVNRRAYGMLASHVKEIYSEGISDEEYGQAVEALRELGIDDSTHEGRIQLTRALMKNIREYQLEKAKDDMMSEFRKEMESFRESLKAEMFGSKTRTADSPDVQRSAGSSGMTTDDDIMRAWQNDEISDTEYYAWRKSKGLPTQSR